MTWQESLAGPEGGWGRAWCSEGRGHLTGRPGRPRPLGASLREHLCGLEAVFYSQHHTQSQRLVQGLCAQPSVGAASGQETPECLGLPARRPFKMLSWGERGERKWEGPGVNHAGWEAWLPPRPGLRASGSGCGAGLCPALLWWSAGSWAQMWGRGPWPACALGRWGAGARPRPTPGPPWTPELRCGRGKYPLGLQPWEGRLRRP